MKLNWFSRHFIYFNSLAPKSQGGGDFSLASVKFKDQVKKDFGSYDGLIAAFNAETLQVPGKVICSARQASLLTLRCDSLGMGLPQIGRAHV